MIIYADTSRSRSSILDHQSIQSSPIARSSYPIPERKRREFKKLHISRDDISSYNSYNSASPLLWKLNSRRWLPSTSSRHWTLSTRNKHSIKRHQCTSKLIYTVFSPRSPRYTDLQDPKYAIIIQIRWFMHNDHIEASRLIRNRKELSIYTYPRERDRRILLASVKD